MKPYIKWAGGKNSVLNNTKKFFPPKYDTYIEPFLGGGAVLFGVAPKKAIISDINTSLINTYVLIRDDPSRLLNALGGLKDNITKESYMDVRNSFNSNPTEKSVEKAAEFIFLNKTCFNGLFRVNKKGEFNVPYGKRILNFDLDYVSNILEISKYLNTNDVQILNQDFREVIKMASSNDMLYLDPPYLVNPKSFTGYTSGGFTRHDYVDLINHVGEAKVRGANAVISNSMEDIEIFGSMNKNVIDRRTSISGFSNVRIKSAEYVYTNF